jgi:methionyl-tRNA formyltransferase
MNGDKQAGVTIFKMDEQMDHGPIVAQFKEDIKPKDTSESLYERLFALGGEVLTTILPSYLKGNIKLRKQNHKKATYTRLLNRDSGKIDWKISDQEIERFIRAMHPWPGSWTRVKILGYKDTRRLKILKAHLERDKLVLDKVQLEGKKPVAWKQFQEGYPRGEILK